MNNHETILNPSYNPAERSDNHYDDLLSSIRVSFDTATSNIREPLFTTDANAFLSDTVIFMTFSLRIFPKTCVRKMIVEHVVIL